MEENRDSEKSADVPSARRRGRDHTKSGAHAHETQDAGRTIKITVPVLPPLLVNFVKKYWAGFLLLGIFVLTLWLRLLPLQHMTKYLPDIDVYYIYRLSEWLVGHGFHLPAVDLLRAYPTGVIPSADFIGVFYIPAVIYAIWNAIAPISFFEFAKLVPAILGAAVVIPLYLVGKEIHSKFAGLLAAFFFATSAAVMYRTAGGVFEKEAISTVFLVFAIYFFIRGLKRDSLISGILAGLSTAALAISWGGIAQLYIGIAILVLLALLVNVFPRSLPKVYAGFFVFGIILPMFITPVINIRSFFVLLNFLALGILAARVAAEKFNLVKKELLHWVAPGLYLLLLIGVFVGSALSATVAGLAFEATHNLFYQQAVIESTVAENIPPSWSDFASSFGVPYTEALLPQLAPLLPIFALWLFAFAGIFIILYKINKSWRDWNIWLPLGLAFLAIIGLAAFLASPSFGAHSLFVLSFIVVLVLAARRDWLMTLMLAMFFVAAIGTLSKARIMFLLGPFAALFGAYALAAAAQFIAARGGLLKIKALKERIASPVFVGLGALFALILIVHLASGFVMASSIGPSFNDNWNGAMNFMKTNTTEDSVILSWWDFGYWFQLMGERATALDGGHPNGDRDHEAARYFTGLMNDSEQREYLQKYSITHILVDYSMIGKYPAMSKIATNGTTVEAFSSFSFSQKFEKNNKTIIVYAAGPYSIWVPMSKDGTLAGNIIISTPRGDAYIKSICGPQGRIDLSPPDDKGIIEGCLFITAQLVYYASDSVANSEFAKLYLMDGFGVDYAKKVFDNGEVKIFETNFTRKTREELLREWKEKGWCKPEFPMCNATLAGVA